ncbi:MAG: MBL fold metallo-hydrolase, partial [Deltaproteobacteria bacterium]|nr:MBL fold metallo-hydrolase [Deltaproteobacteria bacterium]
MTALYVVAAIIVLIALFILFTIIQLKIGREKCRQELNGTRIEKLSPFGSVKNLSILPLVDFYSNDPYLKTEAGVSYLVRVDDTTILVDVGFNAKKEHPSPLLHNMQKLGISPADIDRIFISHPHPDHLGGMNEHKRKSFSLSKGAVAIPEIPVYAPEPVVPSAFNPGPRTNVIDAPTVIGNGIASIGSIPRFLFLMGRTVEQALAVNVAGKGIVLIIGCGHQTIGRIIDRAKALFDEPIYGIIGGLHFPVNGGRIMLGPINIQKLVGTDQPPWIGITESDVDNAISAIKQNTSCKLVSLSPHDSSDWAIARFRSAFSDKYTDLLVG